jgi:tRNA (Thr-GGU) A37 N-methylase
MSGVDLVDGTPILDLKVRYTHPILGLTVVEVVEVVEVRRCISNLVAY